MRVEYLKRGIIAAAAFAALAAAAAGAAETGAIFGFVTDEDGRPLSGALVVVKGADLSATANADGYYVIQQVPVGTFDVKASRIDCGEQVKSGVKVITGLRTNLSFQLESDPELYSLFYSEVPQAGKDGDASTGTISGLVTGEDGQPVKGALVWVTHAPGYAATNADGYYSIQNVQAGTFYVKASRVGGERAMGRVNVGAGLRTTLSLQLRLVAAAEKEEKEEIESQVVDEFADMLVPPPGPVHEDSDASTADEEVPGDSGGEAAEAGTISGFVTDEDWRPLSGTLVVVKGATRFATTDADGYYVITPVPVGTFDVKASRIDYGEQVRTGVKVVAGLRTSTSFQLESKVTGTTYIQLEEPLTDFNRTDTESVIGADAIESQVVDEFADVLVRPSGDYLRDYSSPAWELDKHIRSGFAAGAGWISGFVTDEDGQPLSGASVVVTGADLSATTDADGYYHIFDVPAGTFDVKASRVGCGEQVESGVKVVASLRTNLSFQLRSGVTGKKEEEEDIKSQVVDEFADILARPPGIVHENSDASTSDEEAPGAEGPPAGKAGDAGTGTISGLVTNQEGQPLNGALVVVIGANRYATTNADGYYSIQQVPPGTFDVKAMYAKHEEEETTVKVISGFRTAVSFQLQQWFIFIY